MDGQDELAGLISGSEIQIELRHRRKSFLEKTIMHIEQTEFVQQDWQVTRRNKKTLRIRKPKPIGQQLEDDVWVLCALMGFDVMNGGYQFKLPISDAGSEVPPKQIDVFAVDSETALVVECKASEVEKGRSLQKDLNETRALQDNIRSTIHNYFEGRPRVCFIYATRNIRWSRPDLERAKAHHISIIRYQQLEYYRRLSEIIGKASRHQLQADLLQGSPVQGLRTSVPALKGTFGKRIFYQFAIEPEKLLKLAYVSHRTKIDPDAVGTYQRLLKKKRLSDIAAHINETGGVFPTNVVVNFRQNKGLRFDAAGPSGEDPTVLGILQLPNTYKSAWVIDGQHRLYGFSLSDWGGKGKIPVLAFENLEPSEELGMFVEINSKQVKVPRSLLVELEPELPRLDDSDEQSLLRMYSQLAIDLSESDTSPLWDRVASAWDSEAANRPITLPQLRVAISGSQLLGQMRGDAFAPGFLYRDNWGVTRERAKAVIEKFLSLFSEGASEHWEKDRNAGGFLCTNLGIAALLRLFNAAFTHVSQNQENFDHHKLSTDALVGVVADLMSPVINWFNNATDSDMDRFRGHFGGGAPRAYAFSLMEIVHNQHSPFSPPGLEQHTQEFSAESVNKALEYVTAIEDAIREVTIVVLEQKYGSDVENWWRVGVPLSVRTKAAQKAEADEEGGIPHQFLDLVDYKTIAEVSKNWLDFDRKWTLDPNARSKSDKLAWMDRLNRIRRRVSHSGRRSVSQDDIEFLEEVWVHVETQREAVKS